MYAGMRRLGEGVASCAELAGLQSGGPMLTRSCLADRQDWRSFPGYPHAHQVTSDP